MATWRIVWEVDVEAASAYTAAEQARKMQLDPESIATIFKVRPFGAAEGDGFAIDISEEEGGDNDD